MRFKYPCFSQKVKINFYEYKERIQKYLKSIGENHATVHLRKTKSYYRRDYYYIIEIIFHNGKPWEKKEELDYEFSSHPSMKKKVQSKGKVSKSAVNKTTVSISQVGITIKSDLKENEVVIDKQKLANLIKLDIETNPTLYTRSCHMTNDKLIELYKLVYL